MKIPVIKKAEKAYQYLLNNSNIPVNLIRYDGFGKKLKTETITTFFNNLCLEFPNDVLNEREKLLLDKKITKGLYSVLNSLSLDYFDLHNKCFWEFLSFIEGRRILLKRWPEKTKHRFVFNRRHHLFSLWQKADILYDKENSAPFHFVDLLFNEEMDENQDFLLNLFERSFSGYKTLSKAIVKEIYNPSLQSIVKSKKIRFRKFYRNIFIKIQHRQPVYCFASLNFDEACNYVKAEIQDLFNKPIN